MGLTRRHFLKWILAAGAAVLAGLPHGLATIAGACRIARFPGRIRSLREGDIRQPGRWSG